MLTVDFHRAPTLGGGAQKFKKMEELNNVKNFTRKTVKELLAVRNFRDLYRPRSWITIIENRIYDYRYFITVNMDWKLHQDTDEEQMEKIKKVLFEHEKYIKYLLCVYEYGKNGKLHFHMLLNTSRIRNFERDLTDLFGDSRICNNRYNHAVNVKMIKPNMGETWEQNIDRIIVNYLAKEKHNSEKCWITKQ